MRHIDKAASIVLALCLSIPAPSHGEGSECPPPAPPPDGPIWISTELPLGDDPLSKEEIEAQIRARLMADADDGPVLPESEIRGQVVDETGLGICSQILLQSGHPLSEVLSKTWTDEEGRFTLTGLPAEWFFIWAVEPGAARFAAHSVRVREHRARAVKLVLRSRCPGSGDRR